MKWDTTFEVEVWPLVLTQLDGLCVVLPNHVFVPFSSTPISPRMSLTIFPDFWSFFICFPLFNVYHYVELVSYPPLVQFVYR